uniref:DExD/H-box helicase 60 n=1 Tax=Crocodylus porosus TaxID=8502 RepID=A0A7M4EVX5_CROPO
MSNYCHIFILELRKCLVFLKKLSLYIWKSISQAKHVSLLNDFVESELFVIDGDSLLLMWLYNDKEYLPFFYLVERFLLDFTQKGGKYTIVFFKDAEQLYQNYPHILFLRTTLIQHLKQNTDIDSHTEFFNCLSPEWQIFLKESYPYFMIISDTGLTSLQTDYLQILISHTLSKKINVVLTSGQESDTLRVHGYHVQSMYKHRTFFQQVNYTTPPVWVYRLGAVASSCIRGNLNWRYRKNFLTTVLLLKRIWPEGSNIRQVLCVLTCAVGLKMYSRMLENEKTGALALEDAADLCRMQCLSVAFLFHLSLSQRAHIRTAHSHWTQQVLPFINMQQQCAYFVLKQLTEKSDWKLNLTYLPDLRDTSLLKNLAYYYETEYCTGLDLELGKDLKTEYQYLWDTVTTLAAKCNFGDAFPVRHTSQPFLEEKHEVKGTSNSKNTSTKKIPKIGLIPLKSDVIKDYAGAVLEDLPFLNSDDPAVISLIKEKEFDELRHWHSGKPLSDDYDRTPCNHDAKSKDPLEIRGIQKLQRFYRLYGRSLEGNISKTVVTQTDVPLVPTSTNKSKAEIIAEENQKRIKAKQEKKEQEQWEALSMLIEKEIKKNVAFGIDRLENFLKKCQSQSVKFAAEMAGLHVCFEVWKEHCGKQGEKSKDLSIAVQVMRRVHELLEKYEDLLQKSHQQMLAKCLNYLGFENLACSLSSQVAGNVPLNNEKIAKYATEVGASRFQLQYMGSFLFRDERRDPDPRVHNFIPDSWQRELLDVVDNNESAVIVAPTSSGKTYASYYCMEKVLKESNEGVVVYVSPTKALVNQVVATIYNRFTKTLPHGITICGVFTRDYRHDVMNCQVLVTVPQCLEILLLSPHCQKWVKRIRYVIFDEVHCLGGEIGAEVWEHLLVMIQCPFLALSATISNPDYLTEWLQSVKRYWQEAEGRMKEEMSTSAMKHARTPKLQNPKKSHRVRLVLHGERYNDLEKYVCSVKDDDFVIEHYHPCAALTVDHIEKYGIPSDLALSPRESLQLYDTMVKVWRKWPRAQDLDPEEFLSFKNKIVIKKADARNYEHELKKELTNWIARGQKDKVMKNLKTYPLVGCKYNINAVKLFNIRSVEQQAMKIYVNLVRQNRRNQDPNTEKEIENLRNKQKKMNKILENSTSTLALGINMPCKSVVFSENSVYLDALNYRQMSGRAGRRGQDLIGNVFFYDIPMPKVEKLIKSNVPELKGNFPFSISLVLRLMLLAAKADDKEDAKAKVLSVLKHPLISFKQQRRNKMLKIYFIFSVQFLLKEGYLDQECNPMGFAGLVCHLHYHEPSNFVLVSFLVKGLFHKLCQPIKGSTVFSESVMEELVLVLANLFGRIYLPACTMKFRKKFCQSKVFLEDLPEDFAAAVDEYNSKVEKNFACFLLTVAKLADTEQEYKLPLSKIDFTQKEYGHSKLASYLTSSTKSATAVSPFMWLSGMTDQDLFAAVLRTAGVNIGNAPLLWREKLDYQGRRMPLNAYALDFYKHGSLVALVKDNWLHEGDAYKLLKDFLLVIKSVRVSLGELCDNPDDNVVLAFQQLSESYEAKLYKV